MDRFTNASEYERKEAQGHARAIAFGGATAVFSLVGIWATLAGQPFSTGLLLAVLAGMAAWGVWYGLIYYQALPKEPVEWHEVEEAVIDDAPPAKPASAPPPQIKQQATTIWNGRIKVGNRLVDIPDDVGEAALVRVTQARAGGELDSISLRALDAIGISRNAKNPPNAQSVLAFLRGAGAVDEYDNWTRIGKRDFPSPTDGNASYASGGVAFQSSDATNAATATMPRRVA